MDEDIQNITLVVYDVKNQVWMKTIRRGFDNEYIFDKSDLNYAYTVSKKNAPKPEIKDGEIKMIVLSFALSKGETRQVQVHLENITLVKKSK